VTENGRWIEMKKRIYDTKMNRGRVSILAPLSREGKYTT
jgi:hypothetical protein